MKYTIWQNFGLEGWQPTEFNDKGSALNAIQAGIPVEFRITQEVVLSLKEGVEK